MNSSDDLRNHRISAIGLTLVAFILTIVGIITGNLGWLILGGMMWIPSFLFWWSYKMACELNDP